MEKKNIRIEKILACPHCKKLLSGTGNGLMCPDCKATYPYLSAVPFFLERTLANRYEKEVSSPVNRLKTFLKKNPALFQFLHYAIGSVSYFGLSASQAIALAFGHDLEKKVIVNIGSGIKRIRPEIINVDIFPFANVDVVADAVALPFANESVDMIISESTIEHVPESEKAIQEMIRVVKPGGYLYVSIPFLMGFHASPNDYLRLTHAGLMQKFREFKPLKIGMIGGPASTLVTFLMYFLALPFSIISEAAYNFATYVFLVLLSPLRVFDLLFNMFPKAIEIATVIYLFARKQSK